MKPFISLSDVETPAAVLHVPRFTTNCARMLERCRGLGVSLRPHMKTLKSARAARHAIDPRHGGIAVATLHEASYFAAEGFSDIQLAVCPAPDKLARIETIHAKASKFSFFIDSLVIARAVAERRGATAAPLSVWIEIDCGEHRTGLAADAPELEEIAALLDRAGVNLAGVATHAGQSYDLRTPAEFAVLAQEERAAVIEAAQRLRAAGFACPGVSAGSTPTATYTTSAEGLTELRPGVYMAGDLFQVALQSLARDDLALHVMATVTSLSRPRNELVLDAGALALSKDRSTASLPFGGDWGYGAILDLAAQPSFGPLHICEVYQEHGLVRGERPLPFDRLTVGSRVLVAPNHACMTAAHYRTYAASDGSGQVVDVWPNANGWG